MAKLYEFCLKTLQMLKEAAQQLKISIQKIIWAHPCHFDFAPKKNRGYAQRPGSGYPFGFPSFHPVKNRISFG